MNLIKNVVFLLKIFDHFIEISMIKFKEAKVDCYRNNQNLYSEIFTDIEQRELDKELDNFAKVGYDKLVITIDGKKQILILAKERK